MILDKNRVFGLDTSHWTGIVDWKKAKSSGVIFMIAKAMDGSARIKYFKENYLGAKSAGIFTGMYSWLYDSSVIDISTQASSFAKMYSEFDTDIPPVIDFEWSKPVNPDYKDLKEYLRIFENISGVTPMIYTAPAYWNAYGTQEQFWKKYPLWIANYGVNQPTQIHPWGSDYKIWQWSDSYPSTDFGYPINGEKECDINYFNGNIGEFRQWVNATPVKEKELTQEQKVQILWDSHKELHPVE